MAQPAPQAEPPSQAEPSKPTQSLKPSAGLRSRRGPPAQQIPANQRLPRGGPRPLKGLQKFIAAHKGNSVFSSDNSGADWLRCAVRPVHAVHGNSYCAIGRMWLFAVRIGRLWLLPNFIQIQTSRGSPSDGSARSRR